MPVTILPSAPVMSKRRTTIRSEHLSKYTTTTTIKTNTANTPSELGHFPSTHPHLPTRCPTFAPPVSHDTFTHPRRTPDPTRSTVRRRCVLSSCRRKSRGGGAIICGLPLRLIQEHFGDSFKVALLEPRSSAKLQRDLKVKEADGTPYVLDGGAVRVSKRSNLPW